MKISEQNPRTNVDFFKKLDLSPGDSVTVTVTKSGVDEVLPFEIDTNLDGEFRILGVCK